MKPSRRTPCLIKHRGIRTYGGSTDIAPRILKLCTPRLLYRRRKGSRYPFDRRLGGPHSRSGDGGEEKKSLFCPCWEL